MLFISFLIDQTEDLEQPSNFKGVNDQWFWKKDSEVEGEGKYIHLTKGS